MEKHIGINNMFLSVAKYINNKLQGTYVKKAL